MKFRRVLPVVLPSSLGKLGIDKRALETAVKSSGLSRAEVINLIILYISGITQPESEKHRRIWYVYKGAERCQ